MYRRSHARRAPAGNTATPLVAFLLIASFGLLFVTGCSRSDESAQKMEDDTFTAEDLERFQQLSPDDEADPGVAAAGSGVTTSVAAARSVPSDVDVSNASDPGLRKRYDALRATAGSAAGDVYRVTNEFLNVRAAPSVSAASAGRLNRGDVLTGVEFINGAWAKVKMPDGNPGYVSVRYISKLASEDRLNEEQRKFDGLYFVNFSFLNVRRAPDSGSEKLGELPSQAFVKPLSIDGEWARIAFEGKEGYVSTQFLSPFRPTFLVRQDRYTLPILMVDVRGDGMLAALQKLVPELKKSGAKFITLRDLHDTVLTQEARDARLAPRSVVIGVTGVTADSVRKVSDALTALGIPATIFLRTDTVGISGISEKTILTMLANGFDIQSGGHTGDDLRTLTQAQTQLELWQSRQILENVTKKTVFAVAYPDGAVNDRVIEQTANAGYLFGVGNAPDMQFSREQFLRIPSTVITPDMSVEAITALVQ